MVAHAATPLNGAEDEAARDKVVRLQVWLDRQNFGPGMIDGKGGEFTAKAVELYKEAHGGSELKGEAPQEFKDPVYTTYQVREEDWKQVGPLGTTPEEKALQKEMPYPTMMELVAERFHADPKLVNSLNPDLKLETLKTGDTVKVPNVIPFEIEKLEAGKPPKGTSSPFAPSLTVDTKERILKVMHQDRLMAAFPITPGSEQLPAPVGSWKIESVVALPYYRWDEAMLKEGKRSEEALKLSPGPRNPVGALWMALNKTGIGIHGTDNPWSIGRSASHGCIRLANWDAVTLATMVKVGAPVEIK